MKKAILLLFVALLIGAATGCANGPIRSLFDGNCNQCQSPAMEPSFGMGFDDSSAYVDGEHVTSQYGGSAPSYLDDNYNDPYSNGSNYGGAAISAPVFDSYNSPSHGGTTVPPTSSGPLPSPGGGF